MEAEESAHNLLNKGPLPVFTFELNDEQLPRILYVNSAVKQTFLRDRDDLVGAGADALVLPEDAQEMIHFCRAVFTPDREQQMNSAQHMYIRSRDACGNMLKLQCSAIRMRWHQRWIGVCFMLDISARESMQEELESVHRQGYMSTLVAGIVHDFRNVLTNMIGYAEVLQMSIHDESARQQLGAIIAAGDRGSELITHLLKLSQNGESDTLPAFTPGDQLLQPLENIMGLARLQMPPHIKLVCQIDAPLHDVAISLVEIEQILMNLINNAMQAISNDRGQIHVRISSISDHPLAKPGHPCMRLRVSDNGVGIRSEDMEKVFKAFWTSKFGRGGTGLGLTMVQRIVKRNHGRIEVASEPRKETRFTIYLPPHIAESEENSASADANDSTASAAPLSRPGRQAYPHALPCRVLLVDDVPDILKIHQAMLSRLHHQSTLAENGQQALELFRDPEQQFDLIITDFRMPVMDGLELVEQIRADSSGIPILMITAFGEDRQLQQVADYRVRLINKPVSMEKFERAIAETMAEAGVTA